ncbi:vascular endothelial growth factor receptor 2-like isoform X2 [Metopolophium dirhodum]|uniref:vascular endothelial growth factor receptor 2-like isoform X2 n=1 Tax=Metopolophium dirhodum TaxID=44670 RepID=UPI00298FF774|nr:vascular endothelial growth factor receptor 2-like isoform X2 [Metopolophium dirhodum]XP_060869978.1 vascular endothelial growth factor receptor 2-like isoform X2 [Metopolophium dirhodum]XP_060869979.1 vascular endothelial growth factor receptor 2-like isoform X2 [Metopolophium dirhodum]
MIDHPNPLRILPKVVLAIFLLADESWQQEHSKKLIPVRVNVSLPSTMIPVGSDLMIPCSVEGNPIPTVTWYKDGQLLLDNERTKATENLLIIFRTNTSDLGSYTCKASNLNSSDETTVNITMETANSSTINMGISASVVKVILWTALVQVIFLLLGFCLIHLLINQIRKEEKLKATIKLNATVIHRTKTI